MRRVADLLLKGLIKRTPLLITENEMKKALILLLPILIVGMALIDQPSRSIAQQPPQQQDLTIDSKVRSEVIENLLKELNESYVFPETAKKMEADMRGRIQKNEYDQVTQPARAFAEKLTSDLQSVSHDKHLRVRYSYQPIPVRTEKNEPTEEEKANFNQFMKRINYGFEKVERLQGNIGYIDLLGSRIRKAARKPLPRQ